MRALERVVRYMPSTYRPCSLLTNKKELITRCPYRREDRREYGAAGGTNGLIRFICIVIVSDERTDGTPLSSIIWTWRMGPFFDLYFPPFLFYYVIIFYNNTFFRVKYIIGTRVKGFYFQSLLCIGLNARTNHFIQHPTRFFESMKRKNHRRLVVRELCTARGIKSALTRTTSDSQQK